VKRQKKYFDEEDKDECQKADGRKKFTVYQNVYVVLPIEVIMVVY